MQEEGWFRVHPAGRDGLHLKNTITLQRDYGKSTTAGFQSEGGRKEQAYLAHHADPQEGPISQYLGTVEAPDAEAAIKVAIREFGIADKERQRRLAAQRVG